MDTRKPQKINRKEITFQKKPLGLGKGSFGTVIEGTYTGKENQDPQTVAIKNIDKKETSKKEFKREVKIHALLQGHLNIVKYFGYVPDQYMLVLKREACSVADWCGSLNLTEQVQIMIGMATGLEYMHFQNIIHADIKPENVLLSISDGITVKLCDFGLSKRIGKDKLYPPQGTPIYSPPEYHENSRKPPKLKKKELKQHCKMSKEGDVYSLALTLFVIATNNDKENSFLTVLMNTEDPGNLVKNICDQKLRPTIDKDFPVSLAKLVRRGWSHEPIERPSTQQILSKLQKFQAKNNLSNKPSKVYVKDLTGRMHALDKIQLNSSKSVKEEILNLSGDKKVDLRIVYKGQDVFFRHEILRKNSSKKDYFELKANNLQVLKSIKEESSDEDFMPTKIKISM